MSNLDLSALVTLLGHLGCSYAAAGGADCICVDETDDGLVRLYSGSEEHVGDLDEILAALEDLDGGCGTDAVWAALQDDDEGEDDGQPNSLQEHQDFAQDDDWREAQIEAFEPFGDD